jgi:Amidase
MTHLSARQLVVRLPQIRRIDNTTVSATFNRRVAVARIRSGFCRQVINCFAVGTNLSDLVLERDWTPFINPFNMTGQPATSFHCRLTLAGLPIGLQITGPLYFEALVLRAATALEETNSYSMRHRIHSISQ